MGARPALRAAVLAGLLGAAACLGQGPPPPAPIVCPRTLQLEVNNTSSTPVEVYWLTDGHREYLGTAPPGTATFTVRDAAGSPAFEAGGRRATGLVAGRLSYRLFCV